MPAPNFEVNKTTMIYQKTLQKKEFIDNLITILPTIVKDFEPLPERSKQVLISLFVYWQNHGDLNCNKCLSKLMAELEFGKVSALTIRNCKQRIKKAGWVNSDFQPRGFLQKIHNEGTFTISLKRGVQESTQT